jgi:hypothetical protein
VEDQEDPEHQLVVEQVVVELVVIELIFQVQHLQEHQ